MIVKTTLGSARVSAQPATEPDMPDRLSFAWEEPVVIGKTDYRFGCTLALGSADPATFWFRAVGHHNPPDRKVPAIRSAVEAIEKDLRRELADLLRARWNDVRSLVRESLERYLAVSAPAGEEAKARAVKSERRKLHNREKALARALDDLEREVSVTAFVRRRLEREGLNRR